MAAKPSNLPVVAMKVAPRCGKWIPPHLRTSDTMRAQIAVDALDNVEADLEQTKSQALAMEVALQSVYRNRWIHPHLRHSNTMEVQTTTDALDNAEISSEQTNTRLSQGMDLETQDAVVYRMDRLVQDLIAARKSLEDEKKKTKDKDAQIAQLKQEVAYLRNKAREGGRKHEAAGAEVWKLERASVLASASSEEVNELQRLLAFHKTNGEQVSRQLRDLQATNKDLETQLQATETVLREQMSLLSGLGICAQPGAGSDSQEEKQVAPGRLEDATLQVD
ncbi:hypothetical protein M431DRAFT_509108 [Trichoderma harzianum CBS 226.95]|uniref:Uncharacterized protein n=1 Tax=Trichoderma harzianum CBS 226.95 TaxID=983964 RepID=A0A2T4AAT5_TRIHA|nr:hypothetical protein M431DRAFT_509108 [Trichoderma harzianum CBS 226.95]PTB54103.1 hypothetical protein M431DRAFT_509108 [Trichoderma harzianum CBS 226.95]